MKKQRNNYAFFDESGTDGQSKFLALGLIKVQDAVGLHQELEKVRERHHFKNEIKFVKMSDLRADISKEWIDVFFDFPGVHFYCLVIEKAKVNIPLVNLKKWSKFKFYVKRFLEEDLKRDSVHFYFDSYNKVKDKRFEEYLLTHIRGLEVIEGVDSKNYDAIQMCDLLLGAVRADFEGVITSFYKKNIITSIRNRLEVQKLSQELNTRGFSVRIWRR